MLESQPALHLALVLHELGTNARKYGALSTQGGSVVVRWEVQDNGETRRLLLDWQESGGPRVSAPVSRGFGTTLIEQSLGAHGGQVEISYAERGVTCRITIPVGELRSALPARPVEPGSAAALRSRTDLAGKRVLVVEDEPLIGMVLNEYLEDAGCAVIGPAHSIAKALDFIARESIDAALVDGNLAGQGVNDIVRALRQKQVPFVFVTGYGRESLPEDCSEIAIVEKPFTQEQVLNAIDRLFGQGANVVPLRRDA
jgi:CheY-like chemotaxis protein